MLADLVEEEGAAVGELELADLAASTAPVKAPRSWPNSSLSRSVSGMAPQLMATKARRAAGSRGGGRCATSSLPVPLSPMISTLERVGATSRISSKSRSMGSELADDALEAVALVEHLAERRDLLFELLLLDQVHHPLAQLVEVDRLGQVVVGAHPHGLDRATRSSRRR